jgi:lambda family phage portal protein
MFFLGTPQQSNDWAMARHSFNDEAAAIRSNINTQALAGGNYPAYDSFFDGDKFFGGFGETKIFSADYWTLRTRSVEMFNTNLYAKGLVRRLVTNEINTGLTLESIPNNEMLGLSDDFTTSWSENIENRFSIYAENADLCDFKKEMTFGELQAFVRRNAIIAGDMLIIQKVNKKNALPMVQVIDGAAVSTPLRSVKVAEGHEIKHGVELDKNQRHIAYWVRQKDGTHQRVPARGVRSGRKLAWLVYGSDRLTDEVRGMPLLAIILQSIKELDRYRDSELRAAVINSMVAMFVTKGEERVGTKPLSGGAVRAGTAEAVGYNDSDAPREFNIADSLPGTVYDELQYGEKPESYDTKRPNVNYQAFEQAVVAALAWANEIPPEILLLSFNSNYSASRAAVNEFKLYLNRVRSEFANQFCKPIYQQWLIAETLGGKIQANGLIEAWRDPLQYDIYGAWVLSDWGGAIKPSVDLAKEVKGYKEMNGEGWITNDRAASELTGTKFSKNIKRIAKENQMKADAARPLLELEQEFGQAQVNDALERIEGTPSAKRSNDLFAVDSEIDDIDAEAN